MEECSTFPYAALPPNTIRTFVLHEEVTPEASIEVTDLNVEYIAISYAWADQHGDDARCKKLIVGKSQVMITTNLYDGLLRLGPGRYWADAICINQEDNEERSAQVAVMADIFKHAVSTIAWLGNGDERADKATETFIECLSSTACKGGDPIHYWTSSTGSMISCCDLYQPRFDTGYHDSWDGYYCNQGDEMLKLIESIVSRRYLSRLWIVQELQHSLKLVLRFGSVTIPAERFVAACKALVTSSIVRLPINHKYLNALQQIMTLLKRAQGHHDLYWWLLRTDAQQCKDPRDRVFSLVSLDSTCEVRADYTQDIHDFHITVACYLMRTQGLWTILDYHCVRVSNTSRMPDQPSWVPSYTSGFNMTFNCLHRHDLRMQAAAQAGVIEGTVDAEHRLHCELNVLGQIESTVLGLSLVSIDGKSLALSPEIYQSVVQISLPDHHEVGPALAKEDPLGTWRHGDIVCCEDRTSHLGQLADILILRPTRSVFEVVCTIDFCDLINGRYEDMVAFWDDRQFEKRSFIIE